VVWWWWWWFSGLVVVVVVVVPLEHIHSCFVFFCLIQDQ